MRAFLFLPLLSTLAAADTDPRFAQLRERAEPYEGSLSSFAEHYVGDCSEGGVECGRAAAAFRQQMNGKKFFFIIGEEQVANLSMGFVDTRRGTFTLNWIPFFSAGS